MMLGLIRFPHTLLLAASLLQSSQQASDPRAVVRQALRAVEGDSAAALSARWVDEAERGSRVARLGLATIYRLSYRYDAAEREDLALEHSAAARPDRITAYAWLDRGLALTTRGDLAAADRELTRARSAAHLLHDRAGEAEVLVAITALRRHADGVSVGLAAIDSAVSLAAPSDIELRGRALCVRADLLAALARPDASAQAAAALQLATSAHDPRTVATCLRAREVVVQTSGVATTAGGPLDSAILLLEHIAALQQTVHDRAGLALTLTRIAALQIGDSQLGAARGSLRRSLTDATASGDRASVAADEYLLGIVSMRLGDSEHAARYLRGALATFDALGDENGAMVVRSNLPDLAMLTGDTAGAMHDARIALPYFQRHGDIDIVIAMRRSMATIARAARDWRAARAQLDSARTLARMHGHSEVARELVSDYGRLALARGNLAAAEQLWTRTLRTLTPAEQLDRYEALARLADIHARTGQLDRAEREISLAGYGLDRWRATLPERDLRLFAFQATSDGVSDPGNSVASAIAALAAHGRVGRALTLADQRRARSVTDALLRSNASTDASISASGASSGRNESRPSDTSALDVRISAALPDSTTALIEYFAPSRIAPITLFAVTKRGARAYVLPSPDSIAPLARRLMVLTEGGLDARSPERQLGALLLDSAAAGLPPGIRRIVIVPGGMLQRVPFDMLRLRDGRMVVQRFATSTIPSAATLLALWRRPASMRPVRLLAFGDPVFDTTMQMPAGGTAAASLERYRAGLSDSDGGILPRLPASASEARLVARFAPSADVRLRAAASAAFLKHAPLAGYRIIHFATHALVDDQDNAATALVLSPGEGESGYVSPADLARLHLAADMVVLSACRSARGALIGGEGVQGLTTPLLEAGARSVVASRWQVGDQRTGSFVADFYAALARGLPVTDALRAAKLIAIRRGATPDDWAAFTVVGDPLVRLPLTAPSSGGWTALDATHATRSAIVAAAALVLLALAAGRYGATWNRTRRERRVPPGSAADTHHE